VFLGLSTNEVIVLFGLFVAATMALVMWRHKINLAGGDLLHLMTTTEPPPTATPAAPKG
jgi:hypothetical protein